MLLVFLVEETLSMRLAGWVLGVMMMMMMSMMSSFPLNSEFPSFRTPTPSPLVFPFSSSSL